MKCPAVYIVNGEVYECAKRRERHLGDHRATFVTLFHDYNGRLVATSRVALRWSRWSSEGS